MNKRGKVKLIIVLIEQKELLINAVLIYNSYLVCKKIEIIKKKT